MKATDFDESDLSCIGYKSVGPLYYGSSWYIVELDDSITATEAVKILRDAELFDDVDYDYIMRSDGSVDINVDQSGQQSYLDLLKIRDGWFYMGESKKGGDPSVVVAVIDTGVDYNHIDLRNNIWTNPGEIPGNGIDDDGNGYVDDYYGWNFVDNKNDPMDDNGHGTHVAGTIAASKNGFGILGVAYNCKIMCLKAGNSSGYFSNSDIAEAVRYAQANGASVINMSFGGSSISIAVSEALTDAYNQCVLVASAGNDGLCNNLSHEDKHPVGVTYPAALSCVIGVMSCSLGSHISSFSNYDDTPYDSVEYEVYACGESIISLWPGNKLAVMSGTSMAAPIVSGIAALLRSEYMDRSTYSTKYIQSQIVNTGSTGVLSLDGKFIDNAHSVANARDALEKIPTPSVNLYDYYIFDNSDYNSKNNGDRVADAGETIRIALELQNRGGVASDVQVRLKTIDSHFTLLRSNMSMSDIGTYSVRDGGKIYDSDGNVIGVNNYFEMSIVDDCPNGYLADLVFEVSYKNGLNERDTKVYSGEFTVQITVSNGYKLPETVTEDTVYDGSQRYIVANNFVIPSGVTVIFKEGSVINYYDRMQNYQSSPAIIVYGSLIMEGSKSNYITLAPSNGMEGYVCKLYNIGGQVSLSYVDASNLCSRVAYEYSSGEINKIQDSTIRITGGLGFYDGSLNTVLPEIHVYDVVRSSVLLDAYSADLVSRGTVANSYLRINLNQSVGLELKDVDGSVISSYSTMRFHEDMIISGDFTDSILISEDDGKNPTGCIPVWIKGAIKNAKLMGGYDTYKTTVIQNYYSDGGKSIFESNDSVPFVSSEVIPFIESILVTDSQGENVTTVGAEEVTFTVQFNRPMDMTSDFNLFYGSVTPYSDFKIDGEFTTSTTWVGKSTIKSLIDNGTQHFYAIGGTSEEGLDLVRSVWSFSFDIDTTAAMSMSLRANPTDKGVELDWNQDDYDTLMGYNIYRSTEKDGLYVKINSSVIPSDENHYIDDSAEPGVTYWYTFKVVLTDLSESTPAGRVSCTPTDTIAPVIYHTPVNQGYLGKNLVISCTVTDNISVGDVTLFYRTINATEWNELSMSKQNDRYSATIFGSDLSMVGMQYYITATDGTNVINRGSTEDPFNILIKDASAIATIGDVDGDGSITIKDAQMILQQIGGTRILTDDQFKRADLNGNGTLDMVEVLRILQYINGNVSTLDMTA